jgi:monoterpene epsilon-lactone hydrolase
MFRFKSDRLRLSIVIGVAVVCSPTLVFAQGTPKPFDADGSVNVPAYTLAPSDFVSQEFKEAYAKLLAALDKYPRSPAMDAPKEVWDKFDADYDRIIYKESYDWKLAHYPVEIADTKIAGVHVDIVTPKDGIAARNQHRVLINLHGGGFFAGRGRVAGESEAIPIAAIGKIKVVTVDYRQAPYDKFPAASQDVEAVYRELLKQYKPEAIGIYGCSAGGSLTAQSVAWFQSKGLPSPGAVGILCPAGAIFPPGLHGDSTMWGLMGVPSLVIPTMVSAKPGATGYMAGVDNKNPLAYPAVSDAVLAKFPPTLLLASGRASEMSPTIVLHAHFLELGVDSYLYVMESAWHAAYNVGGHATPEGQHAVNYIARWFDQHLARSKP